MKLQIATRTQAKIKMALQSPSGGGKTMSALMIAYGLIADWSKIAVIDTENYSASLYAHLGAFNVINLTAPFTAEKYIEAIKLCEEASMQVIIIDSISHEWDGAGGILDLHSKMAGNSFTNWSKLTPRHNAFVQAMMQSCCHVIATIRSKQEYVLTEKNGKQVPEKVGLKAITREGMDYEFTIVLDLDIKHHATASKDRTGLFMDKPEFKVTPTTGAQILNWCNRGEPATKEELSTRINSCKSLRELLEIYELYPEQRMSYYNQFSAKKLELQKEAALTETYSIIQNLTNNGTDNHQ